MTRTFVVGYDFSECSEAALAAAVGDVGPGGRVVVVHAYQLPVQRDVTSMLVTSGAIKSWEDVQVAVEETLCRRVAEHGSALDAAYPDVEIDARALKGFPEDVILDLAAEVEADRIVLGTHGRSGIRRLLLGSVAARVVREATVPVLIVKAPS